MQLNDICANAEDQNRGLWFDLAHPVTGKALGMRVKLAGPDSATQARARLALVDELAAMADFEGRVSAKAREAARVNNLARCILDWDVQEDGQAVPFNHANALRLLKSAAWVQAQIDAFAANPRPFWGPL